MYVYTSMVVESWYIRNFSVLTVIVHSGVPDGSNSAVLEGGKIHCLLHSRSGRSHAQRREADVTPARATRKYKKY